MSSVKTAYFSQFIGISADVRGYICLGVRSVLILLNFVTHSAYYELRDANGSRKELLKLKLK